MAERYSSGFVEQRWSLHTSPKQRPLSPTRSQKRPNRIISITDVNDDAICDSQRGSASATVACTSRISSSCIATHQHAFTTVASSSSQSVLYGASSLPSRPPPAYLRQSSSPPCNPDIAAAVSPRKHPNQLDLLIREPVDIPKDCSAKISPPPQRSKIPLASSRIQALKADVSSNSIDIDHEKKQKPTQEAEVTMPSKKCNATGTGVSTIRNPMAYEDDDYSEDDDLGLHRRIEELRWDFSAVDDPEPPARGTPPRPECGSLADLRKHRRPLMSSGGLFNPFLNSWFLAGQESRVARTVARHDAVSRLRGESKHMQVQATEDERRAYEAALTLQLEKEAREREVIAEHLKWLRSVPIQLFAKLALAQDRYELTHKEGTHASVLVSAKKTSASDATLSCAKANAACATETLSVVCPASASASASMPSSSEAHQRCDSPTVFDVAEKGLFSDCVPGKTLTSQLSHISEEGESESEGVPPTSPVMSPQGDADGIDICDLAHSPSRMHCGFSPKSDVWGIEDIVAEIDHPHLTVPYSMHGRYSYGRADSFTRLETGC
eukprot:Opistho-2@23070